MSKHKQGKSQNMLEDEDNNTEENTIEEQEVHTEVEQGDPARKTTTNKETSTKKAPVVRNKEKTVEVVEENDSYFNDLKRENIQRRIETRELKKQLAELTESFTSAKTEFEETKKAQQDRIIRATLSASLNKAGCVDPEMAMGILAKEVKFNKNGDVENDQELVDHLKASKAYFFTGPATTQSHPTPRVASTRQNHASAMSEEEFKKVLKNMGVKSP